MKRTLGAVAAAAAIAISLAACSGGSSTTAGEAKGDINYWLWDANQLPRLPAMRVGLHQNQPGHQSQNHPARIRGGLLDHAD